jgi:hypothetical protein
VLYEQLRFGDTVGEAGKDQGDGQEQEFVISPERRAWLLELQRRVGEFARRPASAPGVKRRRRSAAPASSHRPGCRQRR